jgi:uncharacterized protein YqeY
MSLKEKINNDIKDAMRAREAETLSVLRMLNSAIKEREISLRKGEDVSLSDEQVIQVIASEVKKRKDSVAAYEQGGRKDLSDKENNEIKILEKYLPEQMSDEELEKVVKNIVETCQWHVSLQDFGKIMGQVMPKVKGKADGNRISEMVKKILSE